MNWSDWLLASFAGTIVLTTFAAAMQWLRLTRMNFLFILGTMFVPNRDRAYVVGLAIHFLNGWMLGLLYIALFHTWGLATWWTGLTIGIFHAAFVLLVVMPILPGVHPRMASLHQGPTPTRLLEPPGFLALHYGIQTPVALLVSHMAFGVVLGSLYGGR
jgi:uncharacterized membrane protein YagU involved in acid resistance